MRDIHARPAPSRNSLGRGSRARESGRTRSVHQACCGMDRMLEGCEKQEAPMKALISIATLATLTLCGTIASSAQEPKPIDQSKSAARAAGVDDNMTPYRRLAADTL